jgi:3-hydroxybutyryl-CoA dehydrogenase
MIDSACVCGAGTMGSGIAQVAAASGLPTILYELNQEVLDKAAVSIEKNLQTAVDKNKMTAEEKKQTLSLLTLTNDIGKCSAGLVIEAIVEKLEMKIDLFSKLAAINSKQTIFASNTSSLSITAIAEKIPGPNRVAGMHFFNPPHLMKLVEIVKTEFSDETTIEQLRLLAIRMKKSPVICKDSPGFIVNRVARPFYIESLRIAEEGSVDFATIDAALESAGFKMGPFRLMDLIGNDVNYAVSCSVYEQLGRPERLRPSDIQKEKVEKGELGKKTGRGYY